MEVIINGVVYKPETPLDAEARQLLCAVYGALWAEAYYDPNNDQSREFALRHVGKMARLNELVKFKR